MNMPKIHCLIILFGLAASGGCSKDSTSNGAPGASQGNEAPPVDSSKGEKIVALTDGQITQVLALVDEGEIEQADVALTKGTSPAVREYAQLMVDQHTQSKQQGQQLIAETKIIPSPSPVANDLQANAGKTLEKLKTVDPASFDSTYMKAQLAEHQDVLKLLQDKLLPSATDPALREHLSKTQMLVQHHIEMAKQLQM
jgi:putative membrane protein